MKINLMDEELKYSYLFRFHSVCVKDLEKFCRKQNKFKENIKILFYDVLNNTILQNTENISNRLELNLKIIKQYSFSKINLNESENIEAKKQSNNNITACIKYVTGAKEYLKTKYPEKRQITSSVDQTDSSSFHRTRYNWLFPYETEMIYSLERRTDELYMDSYSINTLLELGFDISSSRSALLLSNNNLNFAIDMLSRPNSQQILSNMLRQRQVKSF